ncbi:hypothetical protein [Micromonospora maritima]|uniref:hypothetical protein n=1 Tax=Micromonospora maritima TaxID=986711 RepID=UPI00157D4EB8|nr:hypothetical protein [Micromonospora maritima]
MVLTSGFLVWLTLCIGGQHYGPKISRGKDRWTKGYLWLSFAGAVLAGASMVDNFLGGWATGIAGFHPLLAWPPVIIMLLILGKDVGADRTPNIPACVCAVLLPSWSVGLGGNVGQGLHNLFSFINGIQGNLNANLFG